MQQRLGITALHLTHDREEAMVIADRIIVPREGPIEQSGSPQEVHHPTSAGVAVSAETAGVESILATRDGGLHIGEGQADGPFEALFRAASARLLHAGETVGDSSLLLSGRIVHSSYPGDVWRYTVDVEGSRFIIDDVARFASGAEVGVAIPAASLHLFRSSGAAGASGG